MFDTTNAMKAKIKSGEYSVHIFNTIAAIGINTRVPIIVYMIVWLIIFFFCAFVSASIKNLNIDSSIKRVIIGHRNNETVQIKSNVPNSLVDTCFV